MSCRTHIAALVLLALPQPAVWTADSPVDSSIKPPIFAPPPEATTTKSQRSEGTNNSHFAIRDPATIASSQVKRADHKTKVTATQKVVLSQAVEEVFDTEETFGDISDDSDFNASGSTQRLEGEVLRDRIERLPPGVGRNRRIRPNPDRRDSGPNSVPWTIPELFNEPEDYQRQACEEEFCSQMWECAGGRNQSMMHRRLRDMRHRHEMGGMGRFGCMPSLLFSGLFVEPFLGYGFFRAPVTGCHGNCTIDQGCVSDPGVWGGHCADGLCRDTVVNDGDVNDGDVNDVDTQCLCH